MGTDGMQWKAFIAAASAIVIGAGIVILTVMS
jgi:hypothetical protein